MCDHGDCGEGKDITDVFKDMISVWRRIMPRQQMKVA
jgi:hypothetical protein